MADHPNSFDARATLGVGGRDLTIYRLDALQSRFDVARLPFSLKVLLENLLRTEGNGAVTAPLPSVRRRFSSRTFSEKGSRATSNRDCSASRR